MTAFLVERNSLPEPTIALLVDDTPSYPAVSKRAPLWSFATATATCFAVMTPSASIAYQTAKPSGRDANQIFTTFAPNDRSSVSEKRGAVVHEFLQHSRESARWAADAAQNLWTRPAADRIEDLSSRPVGWKGEGSTPPSTAVVKDSLALIQRLHAEGCESAPMISAEEDGSLIFFWKANDTLLSFSIDGSSSYSFYAKIGNTSEIGDDLPISDPLPNAVLHIISNLRAERN